MAIYFSREHNFSDTTVLCVCVCVCVCKELRKFEVNVL